MQRCFLNSFLSVFFLVVYSGALYSQESFSQQDSQDEKLFSFALIADIQYADAPTVGLRNYRGSLDKLEKSIEIINDIKPDFAITLGDNIDRDYKSFDKVLPLLSRIDIPLYNVMGNHDFSVDDNFKSSIRKRLNNRRGYFSFERSGYTFIIVDGSDWSTLAHKSGSAAYENGMKKLTEMKAGGAANAQEWNGGIGKKQLAWLDKQLKKADRKNSKVILFCHWPIWPEASTQLWNSDEVLELIQKHPSVFAWISGHHHAGGFVQFQGIHHLTLKGMVESKSFTSFGIMDVYENRIVLHGYGGQYDVAMGSMTENFKNGLISEPYHEVRSGLSNAYYKFQNEKHGRVAFLGGSITHNPGWRDSVMHYLENKFPETDFDFISAGIPSMGSTPGAFRLDRDVLKKGSVDLLFEEAAVNDDTNGRTSTEQIRAMEGIVRHARMANPKTDIVIMYFVDPGKMEDYRAGRVPLVIQNHEKVAQHYSILTINLAEEVTDRIDAGEFNWDDDFKNLHPSPFGQGVYARSIIDFLESAWKLVNTNVTVVKNHPLPEKLNEYCYDNGELIEVQSDMEVPGWLYNQRWEPEDATGTRNNYTNVPMLICEQPGQLLKYQFTGRGVGIAIAAGLDAGILEYRVDGESWKRQNLFTKWSKSLHLPWFYTLAAELQNGDHLLEIRLTDDHDPQSIGHVCRLRYFYVNR